MRGLMRMLMMFGPMLYRMYSKWAAKNQRQQSVEQPESTAHNQNPEVDVKPKDRDIKHDGDEFV